MKTLCIAALAALSAAATVAPLAALAVGDPAPAFKVQDQWKRAWTQAGTAHGAVLVDFWASWCVPCVEEIPTLNALQAKLGAADKFAVLGLNLDKGEQPAAMLAAVRKFKVAYAAAPLDPKVADAFGVEGFPAAVLLRNGKVLKVLTGRHTLAEFEKELAPYLR